VKGKSILLMSTAFVLVLSAAMTNTTVAVSSATMYVDPPIIYDTAKTPGSTFSVQVRIADAVDLFAWEIRMTWAIPLLNVTTVVEGPFLKSQPDGTFFVAKKNQTFGYVDIGCTTNGEHPGVDGSGLLATISFLVEQTGETLLGLPVATILDRYLTPMPLVIAEGYFSNAPPEPADLVGRSAWPDYHHFVISKAGNIQTLFGKVRNLGVATTCVKVNFSGMFEGVPFEAASAEYVLAVGETAVLTASLDVGALGPGKYQATAQVSYRYYSEILSTPLGPWVQGAKTKSFSFAVVP